MAKDFGQLRVLVVEDENFLRALIKNVLEQIGFRNDMIHLCSDGAEALEFLRDRKVDFIISDWYMKPMDGLTFVRTLRDPGQTPAPGVPVILCSGQVGRDSLSQVLDAGVNEVIAKPITVGAVLSRIDAILNSPRPVVELLDYLGPDRRRLNRGTEQGERRGLRREFLGES